MTISTELFLLVASVLLFFSLLIGKTGHKYGVPTLLLFLMIGIMAGTDGLGLEFNSPGITQFIGVIALNIILFSGGMDTNLYEIKPIVTQGLVLATVGVLITAFLTGLFIFWITNSIFTSVSFTLLESLLLGSIMSSTYSASVFSILRSKGLSLKENIRPLLEFESGSNDPMAFMLTIVLIQPILTPDFSTGEAVFMFFRQLILGA